MACDITIDGKEDAAMVLLPNGLYLLDDETLADVMSGLVWCNSCRDFRAGERLEPRSFLEELLSKSLADELPDYHRFIFCEDPLRIEKFQRSLKRTLHWLAFRKSPPRCLDCGSTAIVPIPSNASEEDFVDALGRTISYSEVFASTAIDLRLSLYDTDGNALGEISRICPDTGEYIDDGYCYARIVELLGESNRDRRSH